MFYPGSRKSTQEQAPPVSITAHVKTLVTLDFTAQERLVPLKRLMSFQPERGCIRW